MAPRLPALSRGERVQIVESAISEGRLTVPRGWSPESSIGESQLNRYSNFLRQHPDEGDLVLRDLRGHGRTGEHPGDVVHLTQRGHRREQWRTGAERGEKAEKDAAVRALRHIRGDEVSVYVHGRYRYEAGEDLASGYKSRSGLKSDLVEMIERSDSLEDAMSQWFGVEGMWEHVGVISVAEGPKGE